MTEAGAKLERGVQLLLEAGGDQDLLGVALLALQGALNPRLRALLESNPNLRDDDRALLALPALPTAALVDLCRTHGDLDRDQAWRIAEAERLRSDFVRGEPFRGSPVEVRAYGRFVAELCGRPDLAAQLAAGAAQRPAQRADDDDADRDDDADQPPSGVYITLMRWIPGLALILVLAGATWYLFGRAAEQALPTIGTGPPRVQAPTAPPPDATFGPIIVGRGTPTPVPSPTAAARQGRIVRLGGGPGWLHDAPRFDSPTLPVRLSEGQIVAILGEQASDAQGTTWIYVGAGGYEGWSPLNNVEELR